MDADTRALRTTGYVLSHGTFIEDITETFVFGHYRTYQVPVRNIEEKTGLDFGVLVAADALRRRRVEEPATVVPLDRLEDMVL